MQRDIKVGIALGVALVGIVGALFFRRDPERKEPVPPPLAGAEELDEQIAEKHKAPYLKGVEDYADSKSPAQPPPTARNPRKKSDAYKVPSFLTQDDEEDNRSLLSGKQPVAPDPIQSRKPQTGDTPPAHNSEWEPTGRSIAKGAQPEKSGAAADHGQNLRTHVIRPGDTLSGLASKYLGSSARFKEIYDANRNVLKTPDELPEGVSIVIPEGSKGGGRDGVSPSHTAGSGQPLKTHKTTVRNESADEPPHEDATTTAPRETIRFAPVNRGPFSAGRAARGGASQPPAASKPAKKSAPRIDAGDDDDDPQRDN